MEKNKAQSSTEPADQYRQRGRWKLFLVIAVCAAPLIAAYVVYYVIKPQSRTNYGSLIDPRQYPIPPLSSIKLDGKPGKLTDYTGKWIILQVAGSDCDSACQARLFTLRQLRLMQGKEMGRITRVWLITDTQALGTMLMREYDGTEMLRVDPKLLQAWLPTESGSTATDHIYLIDPLGNLMMRFPKDADPSKMNKDIGKLLRASRIG